MIKQRVIFFLFYFGIIATFGMHTSIAHAALGGSKDSIQDDFKAAHAAHRTMRENPNYTVHEIHTPSGNIREYLLPVDDVIFGIAWDGLTHPDLNQLLGSYADEHDAALEKKPHQHGHRHHHSIKTDTLVVEKWGHMRNMHGRAYDPTLLPAGVDPNEIQ